MNRDRGNLPQIYCTLLNTYQYLFCTTTHAYYTHAQSQTTPTFTTYLLSITVTLFSFP